MSRLQKLVEGFVRAKSSWDSVFLRNLDLTDLTEGVNQKPYTKHELVYICISTTARAISQAPMVMMRKVRRDGDEAMSYKTKSGSYTVLYPKSRRKIHVASLPPGLRKDAWSMKNEVWEPVPEDDPWQALLYQPNYLLSGSQFVNALIGDWLLDGNVWVLGFPTTTTVTPDSLWLIRNGFMDTRIDPQTNILLGWNYKPKGIHGTPIPIDLIKDRVAWVHFWNPYDPYRGMRPLEAGRLPLTTDYKAAMYNDRFFDEGAAPFGVIQSNKDSTVRISDSQFKDLRDQVENRHKGWQRSHRMMILPPGLQYQQMGLSQKNMQFLDLRKYNRESILGIYGMKKAIISVTDDLNYAIALEQKRDWWESTLLPMMKEATETLNTGILKGDPNRWITFDLAGIKALHEDISTKVEAVFKFWQMGFTANELNERMELGFDQAEWRNQAFVPSAMLPVGEDGRPVAPPFDQPEGDEPPAPDDDEDDSDEELPPDNDEGDSPQPPAGEVGPSSPTDQVTVSPEWEKEVGVQWKEIVQKTSAVEKGFESKTRRIFYEMRRRTLRLLQRDLTDGIDSKDYARFLHKNLVDIDQENYLTERALLQKFSRPLYIESVLAGAKSLVDEIDGVMSFDLTDPVVVEYLERKVNKITGIIDTVKRQVGDSLAEGYREGESLTQLAERIKTVFNFADGRAKAIARTEMFGALNFGRTTQISQAGFRRKIWFTAADEKVRSDHAVMHGRKIDIGDNWIVGGATLRYPGDPAGPPREIINCRCIEVVDKTSLEIPEE